MQFYVICKTQGRATHKAYIRFNPEPRVHSEIPYFEFELICGLGHRHRYLRNDVHAEVGLEPIGGAILGGILFLIDPVAGVIGAGAGLFGMWKAEQEKVDRFEASSG